MSNEIARRPLRLVLQGTIATPTLLETFWTHKSAATKKTYESHFRAFARFVRRDLNQALDLLLDNGPGGAHQLVLASAARLNKHGKLKKSGLSSNSIAIHVSALKSFIAHANSAHRIDWTISTKGPKTQPYRDTAGPGLDGWKKIRAQAQADTSVRGRRNLALILLMHNMALRRGECVALDLPGSVRLAEKTLGVINKGKTEPDWLTIPEETFAALVGWIEARGNEPGPLFIRLDPGSLGLQRLDGNSVNQLVRRLSREAGLERESRAHGLRHQATTRALELTGGNVTAVRKLTRHAKIQTVMLYDDNRTDQAGKLAAMLAADNGD